MGNKISDPAVYYGSLPRKYKGKVNFLRGINVSLEGKDVLDLDVRVWDDKHKKPVEGRKGHELYLKRSIGPKLEKKVLETLQNSNGDLVLLEQPKVKILGYGTPVCDPTGTPIVCLDYRISVNGELYKTNGVKTSFKK